MQIFTFRTQLTNPFASPDSFRNLGGVFGSLTKNWGWELEHGFYPRALLDIDINISVHEDHHGLDFTIGLLGYGIHFIIYNRNHYEHNTKESSK